MKLKKGSAEARAYMAKIRAKRKKSTKTETPKKKAAPKKAVTKKAAPKKAAAKRKPATKRTSTHKDSKSHNVRINVVSGIGAINTDLGRKLRNAQEHLAFLVGTLANKKEYYRLTKSPAAKNMIPVLRKKIAEAKKVVTLLKKPYKK